VKHRERVSPIEYDETLDASGGEVISHSGVSYILYFMDVNPTLRVE
jgi:hypothetical protein